MGVVDALTEWRARRWLAVLTTRLGNDGLTVAACVPGLAAAVDQHAAAVRELVCEGGNAETFSERVLLAGYGRGLLDRFDVTLRQVQIDAAGQWTRADWLALRLLAVCAMSRTCAPRPGPARPRPGRSVRAR